VVIAGGGPAGLACAEVLARAGRSVAVLESGHEIGSPIRTSGGSFIEELAALGIPERLYHPISRGRFLSPGNAAAFEFAAPRMCVIDVRGVFQYLAERAIAAGAEVHLKTPAVGPILNAGAVVGVRTPRRKCSTRALGLWRRHSGATASFRADLSASAKRLILLPSDCRPMKDTPKDTPQLAQQPSVTALRLWVCWEPRTPFRKH